MRKKFLKFVFASFLPFFYCASLFAAETFTLDPHHTYILWKINHLGFSTQVGKWYATGTLLLDKSHPANSKVNANFQIADMVTGLPELDQHLKGKLFFDVDHFSTATFASNKVKMTGKDTAKVYGVVTIRGIAKPLVLDVRFNHMGNNPISEKMTVGFSGKAQLKRSDFGMTAFLPALGNEVSIAIEAEAYK